MEEFWPRSVLTTSVKFLPYRPPAQLNNRRCVKIFCFSYCSLKSRPGWRTLLCLGRQIYIWIWTMSKVTLSCLNELFSKDSGGLTDLQIKMIRSSWEKVIPNKKHHGQLLFHRYDQYCLTLSSQIRSNNTQCGTLKPKTVITRDRLASHTSELWLQFLYS